TETQQATRADEQTGGRVKIGHGTATLAAKEPARADGNLSDAAGRDENPADAASEFLDAAIAKAQELLRTDQKNEKQPDEASAGNAGEEDAGESDVGQLLSLLSAADTFAGVGMPVTAQ